MIESGHSKFEIWAVYRMDREFKFVLGDTLSLMQFILPFIFLRCIWFARETEE